MARAASPLPCRGIWRSRFALGWARMFAAALGTVYGRMNRVKDALRRFWTRARGLAGRGRGGDGREKKEKSPGNGVLPRLIPLACALAASGVVFAILTRCESGAYYFPPFGTMRCTSWSQSFGFLSTSAGVGFLIFLTMEVATMIFAQMWKERQIDRAERREEMAEIARMVEVTERMVNLAERRAELAEQARREDAERAERRELLLLELIKSLKNGKDDVSE